MTDTNLTILVIDQNSDYVSAVQHSLEQRTHKNVEVVIEPDLNQALRKMSKREFDVVLAKRDALNSSRFPSHGDGHDRLHPIVGMLEPSELNGDGHAASDFLVKLPVQPDVLTQLILSTIEKYQLKATLQSTENDMRKVIEKNADSILVVDESGALLFWNATAQSLFGNTGLNAGEIFGTPLIAGETTELDIVGNKGERVVAEMRVVNIEWSGQQACLASLRDITQRKLTEELLETKVRERTIELEVLNKELRNMYEVADKAAKVRSQFIANFSHEVRTPLGGVVAAAELLPMADNLDEFHELANTVFNSSKQLLKLVETILDFTKLESGSVPIVQSEFSLRELLDSIIQSVTTIADKNSVHVLCAIDPAIPNAVRTDAVKVRQVILNFVHNGIKFTTNGSVEITATLEDEVSKPVIKISVKDSGIGMSEAECETIFQPFVQGNRRIYGSYGGTGLGLSICKQLVEAMKGTIGFSSEQGKGSTFWFAIPVSTHQA
ncbi:MAG: PAS domain-containing protein [Candidatus Melainabacteria bacterium]|nr:PAS domain-containing protein [Candidatus Melainabacteria bacterium]